MGVREELHRLVDELPDSALPVAERYLVELRLAQRDPVVRAFLEAPEDDEPETDDERQAVAEAREDLAAGRVVSHEEARRRLLG